MVWRQIRSSRPQTRESGRRSSRRRGRIVEEIIGGGVCEERGLDGWDMGGRRVVGGGGEEIFGRKERVGWRAAGGGGRRGGRTDGGRL